MMGNTGMVGGMSNDDINADEFLCGQRDCIAGVEHEDLGSASYDRGYSAQYQMEQIQSEGNHEHR